MFQSFISINRSENYQSMHFPTNTSRCPINFVNPFPMFQSFMHIVNNIIRNQWGVTGLTVRHLETSRQFPSLVM